MNEGLMLLLSPEGVEALREFGDSLIIPNENITTATEQLMDVYQSVEEHVGPHTTQFKEMLYNIKKYLEISNEGLKILKQALYNQADKIEEYLMNGGDDTGVNPPKRVLKRR